MHPATLHGVGVITKLYFAIFAAFKSINQLIILLLNKHKLIN